ncbi:MAG: hypothetical protein COA79_03205 [Planctomycetota bacterium]|nr:MAG: hypothetical protein COA79_03205 [Planctomycetota bacterium]
MKKPLIILFSLLLLGSVSYGQGKREKKDDAELIRDFKNVIANNKIFAFRSASESLKNIKEAILKKHKVYDSFLKVIQNKKKIYYILMRKVSIEMMLYYQSENHRIPNLEAELLKLMVDEKENLQIRKILIEKLPYAINSDNRINFGELKRAFLKVLDTKIKKDDEAGILGLKKAVYRKLSIVEISYTSISAILKRELNDRKSKLKVAVLFYLLHYSELNKKFFEFEIKRFCKKVFQNTNKDFSNLDIANALKLFGNMLKNEGKKVQGSDEQLFLDYLKNDNEDILMAAAESLYKIESTKAVDPIIQRLKEVNTKSLRARNGLIDSLAYLNAFLLRAVGQKKSERKLALEKIRDIFFLILPNVKETKTLGILLDSIDMYGTEGKAEEYVNIKSLEKLVNYLHRTKDEDRSIKIAEILTNYTSLPFGTDARMWASWVKEEKLNPKARFK